MGLYSETWAFEQVGGNRGTPGGLLQEDAADPIRSYYNITSRMFLLTMVLQKLTKSRKEIV